MPSPTCAPSLHTLRSTSTTAATSSKRICAPCPTCTSPSSTPSCWGRRGHSGTSDPGSTGATRWWSTATRGVTSICRLRPTGGTVSGSVWWSTARRGSVRGAPSWPRSCRGRSRPSSRRSRRRSTNGCGGRRALPPAKRPGDSRHHIGSGSGRCPTICRGFRGGSSLTSSGACVSRGAMAPFRNWTSGATALNTLSSSG